MIKNTALILEGGGFRGIFTAGILEVFIENKLFFDAVYGVSAGAAYGVSYVSKQAGRNLAVNDFISDKRYCSWNNLLKEGSMFSWEFVYETIPQKIIPFDYNELKNSESKFYVGTTNCETGEVEFFLLNDADKKDFRTILAASSSLPFIAPLVHYKGKISMDGGLTDSIPFEYALNHGSDRAVVILTQPKNYIKAPLKYPGIFKWYYRKYPKVYELLVSRAERYNDSIRKLEELEKEGQVFIIRPEKTIEIKRVENNPQKTATVYHSAMQQAKNELPKLVRWLRQE
jgi:predicted patatin/cPLA2 family phospholipase